ncbi:MAG: alpha/beta fold hydrolase [Bacteroidota bacterium]
MTLVKALLFFCLSAGSFLFSQSYTEVLDTFYVPTPEYVTTLSLDSLHFPSAVTIPDGGSDFPVLILVHGSAALDKDANSTKDYLDPGSGMIHKAQTRMFYEIADSLSRKGIIVLRYDKRSFTVNCIEQPACWWADTIVPRDYIRDVHFAVEFAKTIPEADTCNIFLAGHSQGGSFVNDVARKRSDVRGVLFLAGTAQPIDTVAVFQTLTVDSDASGAARMRSQFDSLRAGLWSMTDTLYQSHYSPRFWLDWISITDSAVITPQSTLLPTYFLYGDQDKFVPSATHMPIWTNALPTSDYDFHVFPDLDHSFGLESDSSIYGPVLDTLAAWIHRTRQACGPTSATAPNGFSAFDVYPNPVRDILHVDQRLWGAEFEIHSAMGQEMMGGKVTKEGLELGKLPAGLYWISIQSRHGRFGKWILKP